MRPQPPGGSTPIPRSALAAGACLAILASVGCDGRPEHLPIPWAAAPIVAPSSLEAFQVPPPPFSDGIFPCSDCHDPDIEVNRTRRELTLVHSEIVFEHDAEHRWCLDCHSSTDRDMLHLASGELVPFERSYQLCGQCHGDKYRDWRAGVHGRRTGRWDGEKQYLLCVHCHDAHSPRFRAIEPLPAPAPPRRTP